MLMDPGGFGLAQARPPAPGPVVNVGSNALVVQAAQVDRRQLCRAR